jgi:outer membrane protein assembly factor BamA
VVRRDTRDDALGPHRGSLTSLTAAFFPGFLGGAYQMQIYEVDQRTFLSLGTRTVLAMEAYGLYAPGEVPIAELPALGGSSRLRGYFQGRFRDHLYLMGQLEARIRVVWRFSVAPFIGVGNVFPSPSDISFDRTKVAGGLAVRFRLKKERELNVHVDVAKSPISSGVYLNLGEAF